MLREGAMSLSGIELYSLGMSIELVVYEEANLI